MQIIKKNIESLCPDCLKRIQAKTVVKNGSVHMLKSCPDHGDFDIEVDNDAALYKKTVTKPDRKLDNVVYALVLPVTTRCNMRCSNCYYLNNESPVDRPFDEIASLIQTFEGDAIEFSGGEPTVRDDLPELVKYAAQCGKLPGILTNGLKLTSMDYLKQLRAAGLRKIHFSLNGFSDDTLSLVDGIGHLDKKMLALRNIKKLNISTIISFSILRGVNEGDFSKLFKFALSNSSFVKQIRCRSFVTMGRASENLRPLSISEYVSILAKTTGHSKEELLDYWFATETYPGIHLFKIEYLKFLKYKYRKKISSNILAWKIYFFMKLLRDIGTKNTLGAVIRNLKHNPVNFEMDILLWCWPDKYSVDFEEIECHPIKHVSDDGRIQNFFEALILRDRA